MSDPNLLNEPTPEWQQYYPTHRFQHRDILLREYETSARNVEAQERIYGTATNLVLVAATISASIIVSVATRDELWERFASNLNALGIVLLLTTSLSILSVKHFAERQKWILFASRKVVIIRRMLGVSYGNQQLILPNWRIEGADNPFTIRLFPGWFEYVSYPFWIISIFSSIVVGLVISLLLNTLINFEQFVTVLPTLRIDIVAVLSVVGWILGLAAIFRMALYDTHESLLLSFARFAAFAMRLKLVRDFEYVIYRAQLAKHEVIRHTIETDLIKKYIIFIEDRRFFTHPGVSLFALGRAIWSLTGRIRKSGGSTITQQLVRSLFISDYFKTFRRKILEIILSIWFERKFNKKDILDIYLGSVRFDKSVYGVLSAQRYYFENLIPSMSIAESFFLAERISNIRSKVLLGKITHTLEQMKSAGLLGDLEISQIRDVYARMVEHSILDPTDAGMFCECIGP